MVIDLFLQGTNQKLGSITEADLQVLKNALEEEGESDRDYFIDSDTIDGIADGTASDHLVNLLREAVGDSDGVDIRWEKKG